MRELQIVPKNRQAYTTMSNLYAHFRIRLRAVRLYLCDNEALVRVVFGPVVCCCLLAPHTGLCYAGESLLFFYAVGMGIQ